MSEYVEDFEGEDDFEEVETDDDAAEERVNATIEALEGLYGVELDANQAQTVGLLIDQYDYDPAQAWSAVVPEEDNAFEEDFEALVKTVEREQNRTLAESEKDKMRELASAAADNPALGDRASVWTEARKGVRDLDDSQERSEYIGEMLRVEPERDEPSANVIGEDGETKPGFNFDKSNERAAAIDALLEGQDVAGYDSNTPTAEGDE